MATLLLTQAVRSWWGAGAAALLAAAGAPAAGGMSQSPSAETLLTRLAIETAADGELAPIEYPPGANAQFAVYDRFRLVSLAARAALRDGMPLDPAAVPAPLTTPRLVVLAFARSPLGDQPGRPQAIEIRSGDGRQVRRLGALGPGDIASTLPGVTVPPETLVVAFALASLRPSDRVTIVFNDRTAAADSRTLGVMTPRQFSGSVPFIAPKTIDTAVRLPPTVAPPSSPVDVRVEGVLDLTGRVRYARAVSGPAEWRAAAAAAVAAWRYSPALMGGAAVPLVMQTTVTFGPKGQRTLLAHLITPASAAPRWWW